MGPCVTCGQLTEPDADFCPACAGYAAPATVYSYAPGRHSHSDGELRQILAPLPRMRAPALDELHFADHRARRRPGASQRSEGRWLVAAATLIVLIIAAGAVLFELSHHGPTSPPRARPADHTSAPATRVSAAPSPGLQIIVRPAATSSPYQGAVLSFLTSYFAAINSHNFTAYEQLFSLPLQSDLSAAAFSAGYETTTDSAIALTSIAVIGSGELVAQVTFVSHQQPTASPADSACTTWSVSLYLLQEGGSYQLQQPPPGYQASFAVCS
jgi:hypothetical protein